MVDAKKEDIIGLKKNFYIVYSPQYFFYFNIIWGIKIEKEDVGVYFLV